jgi:hypothetical protein
MQKNSTDFSLRYHSLDCLEEILYSIFSDFIAANKKAFG